MHGAVQSDWTYAVTYLELLCDQEKLGNASGFLWRAGKRVFLVSNWHVLAGRDPETQQPRHSSGALPNQLRMLVYQRVSEPDARGYFPLDAIGATFAIVDGEDPPIAKWREHAVWHRQVDIAAIDVTMALRSAPIHFKVANALEHDAVIAPRAGDDAYVVGYPLGILGGSPLPVWKRASIATEPFIDAGNLPRIFVDTATREGMSGSLVVARRTVLGPYTKSDGSQSNTPSSHSWTRFSACTRVGSAHTRCRRK